MLSLVPIAAGARVRATRTDASIGESYGGEVAQHLPPGAVLMTQGDGFLFTMWYEAHVRSRGMDVATVDMGNIRTAWYQRYVFSHHPIACDPKSPENTLDPAAFARRCDTFEKRMAIRPSDPWVSFGFAGNRRLYPTPGSKAPILRANDPQCADKKWHDEHVAKECRCWGYGTTTGAAEEGMLEEDCVESAEEGGVVPREHVEIFAQRIVEDMLHERPVFERNILTQWGGTADNPRGWDGPTYQRVSATYALVSRGRMNQIVWSADLEGHDACADTFRPIPMRPFLRPRAKPPGQERRRAYVPNPRPTLLQASYLVGAVTGRDDDASRAFHPGDPVFMVTDWFEKFYWDATRPRSPGAAHPPRRAGVRLRSRRAPDRIARGRLGHAGADPAPRRGRGAAGGHVPRGRVHGGRGPGPGAPAARRARVRVDGAGVRLLGAVTGFRSAGRVTTLAPPMSAASPAVAPAAAAQPGAWRRFFALDLLDNRYPALHGLRVLAIVTVVQFHVTWILFGEQGVVLDQGFVDQALTVFFGMDLFFILSGFLIGSILLRSLQLAGTQNIRRFYLRRVFRTFPSYYVALIVLALMAPLTAAQRHHLPWEFLYGTNFLKLHRPEVVMFWGWSLALEEQFYLTVPLLFFVLHRIKSDRARIGLLAAIWISALFVRLAIFYRYRPWNDLILYGAIYFRTYTRFDTLVLGIILAFVHNRHGSAITAWLRRPLHRALLALPAMACLWLLVRPTMFGPEHVQLVHVFAWGTVTSIMYFPLLLLLLHGEGWIHDGLSAPFWRRLATLGYGVYLVHIPIIDHVIVPAAQALQARRVSMLLVWPAALFTVMAGSFVIAYAMHVFIEKPSLWIRQKLAA